MRSFKLENIHGEHINPFRFLQNVCRGPQSSWPLPENKIFVLHFFYSSVKWSGWWCAQSPDFHPLLFLPWYAARFLFFLFKFIILLSPQTWEPKAEHKQSLKRPHKTYHTSSNQIILQHSPNKTLKLPTI